MESRCHSSENCSRRPPHRQRANSMRIELPRNALQAGSMPTSEKCPQTRESPGARRRASARLPRHVLGREIEVLLAGRSTALARMSPERTREVAVVAGGRREVGASARYQLAEQVVRVERTKNASQKSTRNASSVVEAHLPVEFLAVELPARAPSRRRPGRALQPGVRRSVVVAARIGRIGSRAALTPSRNTWQWRLTRASAAGRHDPAHQVGVASPHW